MVDAQRGVPWPQEHVSDGYIEPRSAGCGAVSGGVEGPSCRPDALPCQYPSCGVAGGRSLRWLECQAIGGPAVRARSSVVDPVGGVRLQFPANPLALVLTLVLSDGADDPGVHPAG